jgi:hypothetical protein
MTLMIEIRTLVYFFAEAVILLFVAVAIAGVALWLVDWKLRRNLWVKRERTRNTAQLCFDSNRGEPHTIAGRKV